MEEQKHAKETVEIVRKVDRKKTQKNKMKDQHFKKEVGFYMRGQNSNMNGREVSFSYKSQQLFGNNHFS